MLQLVWGSVFSDFSVSPSLGYEMWGTFVVHRFKFCKNGDLSCLAAKPRNLGMHKAQNLA